MACVWTSLINSIGGKRRDVSESKQDDLAPLGDTSVFEGEHSSRTHVIGIDLMGRFRRRGYCGSNLYELKLLLAGATVRAGPGAGNILPARAGRDVLIG